MEKEKERRLYNKINNGKKIKKGQQMGTTGMSKVPSGSTNEPKKFKLVS